VAAADPALQQWLTLTLATDSLGSQAKLDPDVPDLLQPLTRAEPSMRLVSVPGSVALYFFALPYPPPAGDEGLGNDENVRELVNLINWDLRSAGSRLRAHLSNRGVTWQVEAATPNWLTSLAGWDDTDCGPGSLPAPVPHYPFTRDPTDWSFSVPVLESGVPGAPARGAESTLVVVLDTCPSYAEFMAVAQNYGQAAGNRLWHTLSTEAQTPGSPNLGRTFHVDEALYSLPRQELEDHLSRYRPDWKEKLAKVGPDGSYFRVVDHGLFAAGIIRDIAPGADIHLLRVLNDYGVGDLWALTTVLVRVPRIAAARRRRWAVANLSLTAAIPTGADLVVRWLAEPDGASLAVPTGLLESIQQEPDVELYLQDHYPDLYGLLHPLVRSLTAVVDALLVDTGESRGVLIVAAAGNDNDKSGATPPPFAPEPRYPARYDEVLAVAAVNSRGEPAEYSNRGDVERFGTGVATFGGDATRISATPAAGAAAGGATEAPPAEPPETMRSIRAPWDAVVGLYGTAPLPFDFGVTGRGWALWAGTSFATPVAAAVAACVWQADLSADVKTVLRRVVDSADPNSRATTDLTALSAPTLEARQVWR
jgi:subtilisin family serine protease